MQNTQGVLLDGSDTTSREVAPPMATQERQVPSSGSFPFDKFPIELQRNVLRYALPDYLFWQMDMGPHFDEVYNGSTRLPTSLLYVSRLVSSIARSIVTHEIPLLIAPSPNIIEIPGTKMTIDMCSPGRYLPYTSLDHAKLLKQLRNFELKMVTEGSWDFLFRKSRPHDLTSPTPDHQRVKEKIRLVCDALANFNQDIKSLTVTFPCCCDLDEKKSRVAESALVEIFAPLHRLSVARNVTFCCKHTRACDHGPGFFSQSRPKDLVKVKRIESRLEAVYGRLVGEDLDLREQLWKEVKAMERPSCNSYGPEQTMVSNRVEKLFRTLNNHPEKFQRQAQYVKRFIDRHTPQSKEELPPPRRP